jgi:uncharacterized protein (TIGR03663 family)
MKADTVGGRLRRHWPWLAVVLLSSIVHLWALGERSYHHDEAIHSQGAYNLLTNGTYRYDPTYHGPLLYYLTAGTYAVIGANDFSARLPIAVAGVLLIAVAWSLRRPFGERAAWWMALLVTISPTFLYYGRFLRMDVLEVATASAACVAAYRAARGDNRAWIWLGVWTALAFATKENAYVTSALVAAVWVVMAVATGVRRSLPATLAFLQLHRWGILSAVAVAVLVSVPLFTVGFSFPSDWFFPGKAISYWWGQHSIGRVSGPWWYHLPRLALYDFLPIVAALVWAVRRRRRMRTVEFSLILFAVLSVTMYGYLREKVPWLLVHQVWAFVPLAGMQLARTFGPRGRWWSRALAGGALAVTAVFSLAANFVWNEISPNMRHVEALIYVQTCPEIKGVVDEALAFQEQGADPVAAVAGEAGWPLTWYFRKTPVWWAEPKPGMRPPLVLCDPDQEASVRRALGPGYLSERLPLRAWWLMENYRPTLTDIVRYVVWRIPWGDVGSSDVIVLRRMEEITAEGAREIPPPAVLASEVPISSAKVFGDGWLSEPRGVAVRDDGVVAVADVGLSTVVLFDADGRPMPVSISGELQQPEAVAWTRGGLLVIADTWGHRLVLFDPASGSLQPMPVPVQGWYGPRGVAVARDGTVAVADTGNKRVVLLTTRDGLAEARAVGSAGGEPGQYVEPVGLAWLDVDRMLICDTGNHRLQEVDREGVARRVVVLPGAWTDFYSRPQVAVVGPELWLASDTPAAALWVIRDGQPQRVDLAGDGINPTGLAARGSTLYVADLGGRLWAFDLNLNSS